MILWQRFQRGAHSLACVLVAALYAITFAGCASDLTRSEAAPSEAAASELATIGSPKPRTKKTKDVLAASLAKKHKKATTEGWSLESKTAISFPDSKLLDPPPEPNCELEAPELKADDPGKLGYEKQCYRSAAIVARSRLLRLQSSVDNIIRAGFYLSDR
jgi:hypothetical protein